MSIPAEIVCVDCGGRCHLITAEPEEGFEPGDVVVYRCAECNDRWDVVVEDDDLFGRDRGADDAF